MSDFKLDPQLANDTLHVKSLDACELLLLNDARWPWLILAPRIEDAVEWHELFTDQRQDIDLEIANVAGILKALTGCEKVNIASLGNAVRQLHIHIIARSEGDSNWPGPVWGYGTKQDYDTVRAQFLIDSLRDVL